MALRAKIARTAHDLRHGNTLGIPWFGVLKLQVEMPDGRLTKSNLSPEGEVAAQQPDAGGADDLCFAPSAESVKIKYKVGNPASAAQKGRLELWGRFGDAALWSRPLTLDELADGDHEIAWDGAVDVSGDFPDGFVTAEFSPYKLKVVLAGGVKGDPQSAWTFFHVLIHELTLEHGPKKVLARARDKEVWARTDSRGGLPAPGGDALEVRLASNLFKTSSAEMYDNTAYTQYESAWGDGPKLPVFAVIKLRKSDGTAVDAPKAIGNTRFLWDWEDVAEVTAHHHADAKTFLDASLDYDKRKTHPKGDNCHKDRGGKRGPGANPVFEATGGRPPQDSLAAGTFPFRVERAIKRKQGALSRAWGTGEFAGKTGVLFRPARTAGDAYKLTVQVAWDRDAAGKYALDNTRDAPLNAAVKAETGTFRVWRAVDIARVIKKKAGVPVFAVDTFKGYYNKANIRMRDVRDATSTMAAAGYNAALATAVAAEAWYVQAAVDPAVDQHAQGTDVIAFRSWADYQTALRTAKGWTAAQLTTWFAGGGSTLNTASKYHGFCSTWAKRIMGKVCDPYLRQVKGITFMFFQGLYNHENLPGGSGLNGMAINFASANRNRCGFIACPTPSSYGGNANRLEQTTTHEVGHHLFLPHSPHGVSAGAGPSPGDHDTVWTNCTMSYNYSAERKFCGLCLLRLRGWDKTALSNTAANNTRT